MKKQCRRLLAFLLTWMMCLSLMQGTVRAEVFVEPDEQITTDMEVESEEIPDLEDDGSEEEQTQQSVSQTFTGIYINPLYRDVISEEDLVKPNHSESLLGEEECDTDEEQVSLSEEDYVSVEEAVAYLREQMKQRVETIIVKVVTDQKVGMSKKIIDAAMAHTGNPKEGDYLLWQYGGCAYTSRSDSYLGGSYYMTITYTMTYYTTAAQEAELDSAIASVKSSLGLNKASMSDYQKIKAIYDYLTKNITYDYEHLNDNSYKLKHTAYAAMINKTSVCQGYAVLFYRMALECGIDARYVSGRGNGGAHGWNIVKLGNCYYNVDATWDAVYQDYRCFLKTDGNFEDHTRNAEYATVDFHAAYPMANVDYDANHTHTYNAWTTVKTATCTQTGSRARVCSTCGNKETQTIAKTDHTIVTDAAVEATCTKKGKTQGSHCSVCKAVIKAQSEVPMKAHQYGAWKTVRKASCTAEGSQERTCSVCSNKQTQVVAKTGHTIVTDAAVEATCTKKGKTQGSHCSVCKAVLKEQKEIPAKGHKIVKDAAVEATCTEAGKTEGSHCSVCEEIIKEQKEIPPKGHKYGEWKTEEGGDCTEEVKQSRTCEECQKTETKTLEAPGHKIVKDAAVEATCTETGLTEGSHCSVCGKVLEEQEVTPIDEGEHIWGEWQTISLPTIFEAEKQERYCIVCENAYETRDKGFKLKKTISVTQSSLMMQTKQKITDFQVVFANGDSVKSWESSNTKVVKVSGETDGTCIIAAQSKTGNAVITITLESGLKKTIQVKVQKGTVTATSLKLPFVKVTIKKGRTLTLKPVIRPITNQSKVTYSSSNKSIATVSSKGVVKGVKKGTAKITVRAGKKKVTCTVVVK